ncbi:hypothetical protein C8R47DRAFT_1189548 [Mycena vitilis]|nr:hypothetical protein C8R47DRAFT_1189548 [Mycena vitilis]
MTAPFSMPMRLFTTAYTRSRISKIDTEIATHKMSITKLKYEQAILENHLQKYIYPVLTLPSEIVSEIFLQISDSDPSDSPFDSADTSLSRPTSPLFLGHICGRWRDIALSTPSLWTTISLTTDIRNTNSRLQLLDIWLARSRQCPLFVTITDNNKSHNRASLVRRFIEAIVPHHKRLEVLRLKVGVYELPKFRTELPLLRILHIRPAVWLHYPRAPARVSPLFYRAPKLTTLVLHGVHRTLLPMPWEQLTSISILTRACLENVVQILRSAPNLTDFTTELGQLSLSANATADFPPIPPLMHLRYLSLPPPPVGNTEITTALQHRLLGMLTLPALNQLSVGGTLVCTVVNLIRRSSCSLQALHTIHIAKRQYSQVLSSDGEVELLTEDESEEDGSTTDEEDVNDEF